MPAILPIYAHIHTYSFKDIFLKDDISPGSKDSLPILACLLIPSITKSSAGIPGLSLDGPQVLGRFDLVNTLFAGISAGVTWYVELSFGNDRVIVCGKDASL